MKYRVLNVIGFADRANYVLRATDSPSHDIGIDCPKEGEVATKLQKAFKEQQRVTLVVGSE